LNIKKKEIRDKPLKASHLLVAYLNPNISLCIVLLQFLLCIVFYIAITPYIAIFGKKNLKGKRWGRPPQ
jgi:hypothetical protein